MIDHRNGEAAYEAYQAQRYFGSLDGLRCFCILLVLWHHRPPALFEGVELPTIFSRGFSGVDFFFVLSGFLITTLLLREESRDGRFSISGFYFRRLLRIVPVYFLVVTLCALWWIGVRDQDQWWPLLPYYYGFLANFLNDDIPLLAPTWSLSVEEQYYLLWPAALLLLPLFKARISLLVALILFALAVGEGIFDAPEPVPPTEHARFHLPMASYAAILSGALLGLILHSRRGFLTLWRCLGARWMPGVLVVALLVAWQTLPGELTGWPNLVMHSLMVGILCTLVLREDNAFAGLLRFRLVARIGEISYGLYLWHLIGLHIGHEVTDKLGFEGLPAGLFAALIYVVASVVIAEMSFRFFESYFLRLRHRVRRQGVDQKNPG